MAHFQATATAKAPGIDLTGFHNCLLTLSLRRRGYNAMLDGLMQGMFHYRTLTPETRWSFGRVLQALAADRAKPIPGINAGYEERRQMWQLERLRNEAYGPTVDDWSISHRPEILRYPWALTAGEFRKALRATSGGAMPSTDDFETHPRVAKFRDFQNEVGMDFVADRAVQALKTLFVAAAPEVAKRIGMGAEGGPWGIALGATASIASVIWDEAEASSVLRSYQARYEIDRVRRGVHAQ